jgi:hypothetical protein
MFRYYSVIRTVSFFYLKKNELIGELSAKTQTSTLQVKKQGKTPKERKAEFLG